ncbi:hypothetical protein LZ554_007289 [Drepanopeziza brunnea f. sp. 'monogermtubi']|nr:hypothetical protein LZ554_007289 [Drepanopeziza brunnea f. sp. 'monogermtubi']
MIFTAFAVQLSCYGDESFRRIRCIPRESTLVGQIWNYALELGQMLNPTSWSEYYPTGLPHFWTLPAEHRGSMVVFLLCLGLGNTQPVVRLAFLATFALFFLHIGRYDTFLFVSGSILAELRVWRREHPLDLASRFSDARARLLFRASRSAAWTAVCVAGLFLGSWPDSQACTAYGFRHLCGITPAAYGGPPTGGHPDGAGVDALRNFWTAIGAFLLLLSMENFEILQRPFTTGLASYMGDISFGFYIIHWTVLFTLGSFLISFFRACLPYGPPTYNAGYFVGGLVTTIFALWAGDVYWRAFDRTSVKFARWLNGLCAK